MNPREFRLLQKLASIHGIQPTYKDMSGKLCRSGPETLIALLKTFGVSAGEDHDIAVALDVAVEKQWQQVLSPVHVAWEGRAGEIALSLPEKWSPRKIESRLLLEDGTERKWTTPLDRCTVKNKASFASGSYVRRLISLPCVPIGYHQFEVNTPAGVAEVMIICAPQESFVEPGAPRIWGLFLPMYACHSERSWGAGDLGDWRRLCQWSSRLGADFVGTLPLMPAYLDRPFEPSPYSPVSRLFWNEFFIDVSAVPELAKCRAAQQIVRSTSFHEQLKILQDARLVDYKPAMALKRRVLESLAQFFFASNSSRRADFEQFCRKHPEIDKYARFRATTEEQERTWQEWPERLRNGELRAGDYREEVKNYHRFVQWLTQQQIDDVLRQSRAAGLKLYLDLPLGVNSGGYDSWRYRSQFAVGNSVGAPPDPYFTKGQDWGFSPLDPAAIRREYYKYVLQTYRFQMRHAGILRLDHVMGLHRLYWIPQGMAASQGAYVSYPADEFYALLCLESHRHRTTLVGENLGTVPPEVHRRMTRHKLSKMYVVQYEVKGDEAAVLRRPPADVAASLNTHDMPPFAAYHEGLDVRDRADLGLIPPKKLTGEIRRRSKDVNALRAFLRKQGWLHHRHSAPGEVIKALMGFLSASRAEMVVVNLEDLWRETLSQNVPGTSKERPNWRRKVRYRLEQFTDLPEVQGILAYINDLREQDRGMARTKAQRKTSTQD